MARLMRVCRYPWVVTLLAAGSAAAEPALEPSSAVVDLGRLFTTPAQRLRIESQVVDPPAVAVPPAPPGAYGPPAPLPSAINVPSAPPSARMYGNLRRDGNTLAEWPRRRQGKASAAAIRAGARRIEIPPTHPGGQLQRGAHRLYTWPR